MAGNLFDGPLKMVGIAALFALLPQCCFAQWQMNGLDFSANGNLLIGRFTTHEHVFLNRQQAGTLATQLQAQTMVQWEKDRHYLGTGLGYRLDRWTMNRTNIADVLLAILVIPFGGTGNINAGWPERVTVNVHQISVPLSYAYRLTSRGNAPVQFSTRLMLIPAFAIGNTVNITAQSEPAPGMATALKSEYADHAGKFSLMVAPEINLHFVPTPGGIQIYIGLQPFAWDAVQPLDTWMEGGLVLRTAFGLRVPLVKK